MSRGASAGGGACLCTAGVGAFFLRGPTSGVVLLAALGSFKLAGGGGRRGGAAASVPCIISSQSIS